MSSMMNYTAPGKLFISGEWAILEVGNRGLVAAVNNRVRVSIEPADEIIITAAEFGIREAKAEYGNRLVFTNIEDNQKETLRLVGEAISISLKFLGNKNIHHKTFHLVTNSKDTQFEVNGQLKKVGFGSSAAIVVATIAAVLDFHSYKATKDEIYKLSTIAHYYAQGKVGSAFDVAASTYGGLFVYSRFNPEWLTKKIEDGESLDTIVKEKWPGLVIEELEIPSDFHLLVGWTGDSASTSAMIRQMNEFKANNNKEYYSICNKIGAVAKKSIEAFNGKHYEIFLACLIENEELLRELSEASGVNIETPELKRLAEIAADYNAAGKLSGAGGGDCGIAVCFDAIIANNVVSAWEEEGLIPLDVTIDRNGIRKE